MKINYQDKEFINADLSTPNKNKVTDLDMNEIKNVVNTNADTLDDTTERMTTLEQDANTRIGDMEQAIVDFGQDITEMQNSIEGVEEDIQVILNETYTKSEVYNKEETDNIIETSSRVILGDLEDEEEARQSADVNLQNQIDSIVASSDVVDIVGTYQELLNYDTTHLGDNDIIKVLDDSTHNNATSYFRWKKSTSTWQYIGSEGPYYTKSETDTLLNGKVNVVSGKGLSTNDFTDADKTKLNGIESGAQVNKLESVKVNGSTQPITNKSVDISVPTKTSELQNDSDYVKNTDYASASVGGVIKIDTNYGIERLSSGIVYAGTTSYANYGIKNEHYFISKGTLDNVLNARIGDIETLLYNINRGSGV